jgi:hypothetical protein
MPYTTYNCNTLTGGAARALDSYAIAGLSDGDRAICAVSGELLFFLFVAASTEAEDVAIHPYKVRPDDYSTSGVWEEQQAIKGLSYAADAEASDTYVITLIPAPAAYYNGMVVNFKANTANTGPATLNVNALGAITIKKHHDQDLETGDIESGQIVTVVYDGTNFQMQSQAAISTLELLFTDQGDSVYASAAKTLARLAKGAANTKKFMNAAGTAPEWGEGIKTGTFTRQMDAVGGTVAYTGVGFKPAAVLFFGGWSGGKIVTFFGASNSTRHYALADAYGVGPDIYSITTSASILLSESSGVGQTATITTYGSDGFTLTWVKNGSPASATATMQYVAFR